MLDAIGANVLLGIVGALCLMGLTDVVMLVVSGLTSPRHTPTGKMPLARHLTPRRSRTRVR